jgi:hypothetical protein
MTVSTTLTMHTPAALELIAAERLILSTVGNEHDGLYFEIDLPLAVNTIEAEHKSQVSAARDSWSDTWQVYLATASDDAMEAEHARDFGAQLIRAADLAQRLNEAAI